MARVERSQLNQKPILLTNKQMNIFKWGWQPNARHRVAVCGRRFGKTFLAMREIRRAAQLIAKWNIDPDNEIWFGSPTFKQAKKNFWQRLKRAIPRHWLASKPNESECYLTLVTGHIIRLVGLNEYENLRGSGLFFFIGDEWADVKPEVWPEVIRPMLSTCNGHSLRIGTPKGFNDFYDIFQKGQSDKTEDYGFKSFQYTSIQGGNIPAAEIAEARKDLDPRAFDQEYNASFVTYSGRVIHAFSRPDHAKACPYNPKLPLHVGMDFNVNPMTAMVWQELGGASAEARDLGIKLLTAGDTISVQVGEVVIPTSDTVEMCNEIVKRYGKPGGPNKHITIYPDPAGAQHRTSAQGKTDISILCEPQFGFKVKAMASHPLVRDRNNITNSRFKNTDGEFRAFIDPSCKHSIMAMERLTYKEGTSDPDKGGGFDHPVDATGYYMFTRFDKRQEIKFLNLPHMER